MDICGEVKEFMLRKITDEYEEVGNALDLFAKIEDGHKKKLKLLEYKLKQANNLY